MSALKLGFACVASLLVAGCDSTGQSGEDDKIVTEQVSCEDFVYEFLIDASWSMSGAKWDAMRDALTRQFHEFGAEGDTHIRVGAFMMGSERSPTLDPLTMANADAAKLFENLVDRDEPGEGPADTWDSLQIAYGRIRKYKTSNCVVVLLSGAVPHNSQYVSAEMRRTDADLQERTLKSISEARAYDRIRTYAIGLGPLTAPTKKYSAEFMSEVAREGGVAPLGCNPTSLDPSRICHVNITPTEASGEMSAELSRALHAMRARVEGCH